jgi:hypothetical protein
MESRKLGASDGREQIEFQVMTACAETITTVNEAIRTVQTAALDVRDEVVALQRLHEQIKGAALPPELGNALRIALAQGVALVHTFDMMGLYDAVPIELL